MKIAFSTLGCPDWSFPKTVETAHDLGYDGVELRFLDGSLDLLHAETLSSRTREWALKFLQEMNVEICCLCSSVRFDDPSAMKRAGQKQVGMEFIDRAQAMGIPFVRVFGDKIPDADARLRVIDWVSEGLRSLGAYAAGKKVTVLLESHGDFAQSDTLREVMLRANSPNIGVLWDTHHPWRFHGEAPKDTALKVGQWIRHTHWKDSVGAADASQYVLFGQGEFPARDFLDALHLINYDGWLTFEWEKKWHPEIAEPEVALPQFIAKMKELIGIA